MHTFVSLFFRLMLKGLWIGRTFCKEIQLYSSMATEYGGGGGGGGGGEGGNGVTLSLYSCSISVSCRFGTLIMHNIQRPLFRSGLR